MKKLSIIIGIVAVVMAVVIILFGLYPVARVDGDTIWYRAYNSRVIAFESFNERDALARGEAPPTEEEKQDFRRLVLEDLIIEHVVATYIDEQYPTLDLTGEADARVEAALAEADQEMLARAARDLYRWRMKEFRANVLLPKAYEGVLREQLAKSGEIYEDVIEDELHNAAITTYRVPWEWQDVELVDPTQN